jgi:DUF1680 family protein
LEFISFSDIELTGGFWKHYADINRNVTAKSVYDRFLETGRFDALRCNWQEGMPNKPHIFWDSDVAKWIEGVAYLIQTSPSAELENLVDELIDRIVINQRSDGYFNSYFLTVDPSGIYTERANHELYCTGHLIEAAIAYHKATGKRALLECMCKNADYIYRVFVEEQSAAFVTPGHEEIELALLKLYEYEGNKKYLELARFFINQRGNNDKEDKRKYHQADKPVRDITNAAGHAVRAGYLYTAMAMLARIDRDAPLKEACKRLWDDIINHKVSITGGVGSDKDEERFTYPYNLPNRDTYNETCAAIALAMFAGAMQELSNDTAYANVIERIYFNSFLSGLSLDGDKFFYSNALEIDRKKYMHSTYQPVCRRVKVFSCSCCPPNVVRMLASIPRYQYSVENNNIYFHQFAESTANLTVSGKPAVLTQQTSYPADGKITFTYQGEPATLFVRIPDWCVEYTGATEDGYAKISLKDGDAVTVDLPMEVHFIEANPYVQDDAGRYAVMRGPLVYCMEEIDNGENLRDITLLENSSVHIAQEELPAPVIYIPAQRRLPVSTLYSLKNDKRQTFTARLIPYFSFANREETDMLIWTMVK